MSKTYNFVMTWQVVILISGIFFITCSKKSDGETKATYAPPKDGALPVSTQAVVVNEGLLVDVIRSAGIAEGIRESWVVSETQGYITQVNFQLGQNVPKDQVLVTVENEVAAQNLALAESQYNTAQLEFEAAKESSQNNAISRLQFSQTRDRLLAARSSLTTAKNNYDNTFLKAPFAGAIAARDSNLNVGTYLARGVSVARIVDYSAYRTEVSVGEGQILLIKRNSAVKVSGNDGLSRNGWVSEISAGSDGRTGSFIVVIQWEPLPNDSLKSGMTVDVNIQAVSKDKKIIAPARAIRVRGGKQFVYVNSDNTAEQRFIDTGNRLGERVEVLSGLNVGDIVITSGIASLTPGAPVKTTLTNGQNDLDNS